MPSTHPLSKQHHRALARRGPGDTDPLGEPVLVAQEQDNLPKSPWDFLVTSGPG